MITIAPPEKPRPVEAEIELLPPAPIPEPEPIEPPAPPPIPWYEDLAAHPKWAPPGNPWKKAPDGTVWQAGDRRHGLHWIALEPAIGEPGVWKRSKRPVVDFDPLRGLRTALDGAHAYQAHLDRNPPPDALERELRILETHSPAIAAAQRAQIGRPDARRTRFEGDSFDPGTISYDRRLVGWGVDIKSMLTSHLRTTAVAEFSPFDVFCPALATGDALNSMSLRAGFGLVVTDYSQFVPGRGDIAVRIFTSIDTPQTWITWIH